MAGEASFEGHGSENQAFAKARACRVYAQVWNGQLPGGKTAADALAKEIPRQHKIDVALGGARFLDAVGDRLFEHLASVFSQQRSP